MPHVSQLGPENAAYQATPAFDGSLEEFVVAQLEAGGGGADLKAALERQARNRVRKCPSCGKPNAVTLNTCNACGFNISAVEASFTSNVFTGFCFGVKKGPFPLTISMRSQTPETLVFDDILALSPCHLNSIPADCYVPDMRTLFAWPAQGAALLRRLYGASWAVAAAQFLGNEAWKAKILSPEAGKLDEDALKGHVVAGLNYPPSQYQLHVQFIVPPFLPHHHRLYLDGTHFTYGRFFPIEYVLAALDAMVAAGDRLPDAPSMDVGDLIAHVSANHGIHYHEVHRACYARAGESHGLLANWQPGDFTAAFLDGKKVLLDGSVPPVLEEAGDIMGRMRQDTLALQNYGRPYSDAGKPTGSFYKFVKPAPLPEWVDLCAAAAAAADGKA